jgi:hypothetical protein
VRNGWISGGLIALLVLVEYAVPGRAIFHAGWYNVALVVLAVWAIVASGRNPGSLLFTFGVCVIAFTGVAAGLLGPDDRTIVGAPGSTVPLSDAGGSLVFPLVDQRDAGVLLERGTHATPIRGERFIATAALRTMPRTVVAIDARDARGAHLTVTQPSGTAFLSPVLLMQSHQTIGGFSLPYDEFALPGVHLIVKTVLFSQEQAQSLSALAALNGPVVLFDLEDETGASLPHGIAIAGDGGTASIGGVRLTPRVLSYPSIDVLYVPDADAVAFGVLAAIAGLLLTLRRNRDTMPQR